MLLSQVVFGGVLAFGAGIFFASFFSSSYFFLFLVLVAGVTLVSVFWGQRQLLVSDGQSRRSSRGAVKDCPKLPLLVSLGTFFMVAAFGMGHYTYATQLPEPILLTQNISFEGRIATTPEKDEQGMRVVVKAQEIPGKILLFASSFEKITQGDSVLVSGKLQSPTVFEDFNYPLYLAKDGIFFVMFHPTIDIQERGSSFFVNLKETLQAKIDTFLPQPQSSLLSAMLLGNKAGLPEDLKEDLSITGTRHITAISGMHVAILSGMLFFFLLYTGMPRKKSSLVVLGFLLFFITFTGFQASAVRAGIMGSAFLIAGLAGRKSIGLRILVFAAAFMLLENPLLLAHDIGFQLSFLAVFGILLFLPLLQHVFWRLANPFGLRDIVFMSITAQIFTLPLVLHHFGILSFVSLIANLAIVPLLPFVLLFGILFLFLSMLLPFLSFVFVFPVGLLLSYLSFVITMFSELPFAAGNVEGFSAWILFPLLLPASFFAWRFQKQKRFLFTKERMIL